MAIAELRTPSLWGRRMAVRFSADLSLDGQSNEGGMPELSLEYVASPHTANHVQILKESDCQMHQTSSLRNLPRRGPDL